MRNIQTEADWHKCWRPLIPKKDCYTDQYLGPGQVFRRKRDGVWQYSTDEELCDYRLEKFMT